MLRQAFEHYQEHSDSITPETVSLVYYQRPPAFAKACPHLDDGELMWRVFFVIGAMAHILMDSFDLKSYSEGLCDPRDVDATTAYLGQFAAAALRAPATGFVAAEQEEAGNA